jgi:hypothetical protein
MAQPIVLRFKSDTESARRAVMALGTTVATSMASVSAAAIAAHQSTGVSIGGIATTALKAAASLTAMQYAAIAAFAAFTAAAAAGAAELERFQKIAESAAKANVGTTFFQAFIDGARGMRVEAKQLESDLAALEKSTRDKFDADRAGNVSNRAGDLLQERFRGTNDFGISNAPTLFANAKNEEERIRAVLVGLRDMEAAGQRLAAIDFARQLGMTTLPDLVERGRQSFSGFLSEVERVAATGVQDGSLISPDLIARADGLKRKWEENSQELSRNLRPILDECARLALAIGAGAVWTAEQFTRLIGVVGAVVQALRTATVEATALQGAAARAARNSPPASPMPEPAIDDEAGQARAARERGWERVRRSVTGQAERRMEEDQNEAARESRRAAALGNLPGQVAPTYFSAPTPDFRPASAGAGSAPSSGGSSAEETDKRTEAIEKFTRAQEKAIALSQIELDTIGKSAVERARLTEVAKAEAAAREHGGRLTEDERTKIAALAEAQQRLKNAIEDATAAQRAQAEALQWIGDKLVDVALRGGKVSDVFRALAVEMARAALTGQGIFAKLLGLAPAAGSPTGSLGGLLGLLGGLFGSGGGGGGILSAFGLFHDGGVVGDGRISGYAPAALFAHAPRFHGGGGLGPSEIPIIGEIGEEMLTRNQRRAVASSLAMGDAAIDALSRRSGGVTVANTYHFNNVTAADRAAIIAEVERRDQEVAQAIVPAVQNADRTGVEILPYSRNR